MPISLIVILPQSFIMHFPEVNYVNVGFIDGLDVSHSGVDTEGRGPVDPSDGYAVARLHFVH